MFAWSLALAIATVQLKDDQERWSTGAIFMLSSSDRRDDEAIAKLTWKNPPVKEEFDLLNLAYQVTNGYLLAWDKRLYDEDASAQRIETWKKFASGRLNVGDVIELDEFYGAISNKHDRLRDQFGVTKENASKLKGQVVLFRELTLEAPDGRRLKVGIQAGGTNSLPPAPNNDKMPAQPTLKANDDSSKAGEDIMVRSYGFRSDPLAQYLALSQLCQMLYDVQSKEMILISGLIDEFERQVNDTHPEWATGSLVLSNEEKESVLMALQGQTMLDSTWKDYKVVGSEVVPGMRLQFLVRQDATSGLSRGTYVLLDRPIQPKPIIKP